MEKENVDTNAGASAPKKRCLSLSLKKHSRFADVSEETVERCRLNSRRTKQFEEVVDCVKKHKESWILLIKEIGVVGVLNMHFSQKSAK